MPSQSPSDSREDRLAAKLRENLQRRKQQARAKQGCGETDNESEPLPKSSLKS